MNNIEFFRSLISQGILQENEAHQLMNLHQGNMLAVLHHLLKERRSLKSMLGRLWGDSINFAYVDLNQVIFQRDVVEKLPEMFARKAVAIPLYQYGNGVTLAMANPLKSEVIKRAEKMIGLSVSPVFSFKDEILDAIDIQYQSRVSIRELADRIPERLLFKDINDLDRNNMKFLSQERSVINFTQALIHYGIKLGASDIYIEYKDKGTMTVRCRIDGILRTVMDFDNIYYHPVSARLRQLANISMSRKAYVQTGNVAIELNNREINAKCTIFLTLFGEKIIFRLLNQKMTQMIPELEHMVLSAAVLEGLEEIIQSKSCLFFVSGPMGSGKTDFLYAIVNKLESSGRHIVSLENPIRYPLESVDQIEWHSFRKDTTGSIFENMESLDPDIIYFSRVSNSETAETAFQLAATGRKVIAGIDADTSIHALSMLFGFKIDPFVIASMLSGILSIQSVRRLCDVCKERYPLNEQETEKWFIHDGDDEVFCFRGKGCPRCNNTGFNGIVGVHELLTVTSHIQKLILDKTAPVEIADSAWNSGFRPMRYDGLKKVLRGLTHINEIERITIQ